MELRTFAILLVSLSCGAPSGAATGPVQMTSPGGTLPSAPQAQTGVAGDALLSQPGASAPEVLTLEQAVSRARQNSPRMRGAGATTERTRAVIRTTRAYVNPSVEVFAGRQSARPIATPGVPGLLTHYAAYQAIEIPAERRARLREAQLASRSSVYGESSVGLSVVADAKHAFYEVLRRKEEVEHTRENLQLVEDLRRRVEVEVRVGEKGRLELTRAEAELARARFAVRSAQLELANGIAVLRVVIAAQPEANLDPRGDLEAPMVLPPLTETREAILRAHPAMMQARTDVEGSQATLTHQRTLRIPVPTAFGEYERQPDLSFWRMGVTIPIPLWDRRGGQIAEAQAVIRQNRAVLDQRQLEIVSALERAYEQYQLADQQVKSLESGSLHEAESAVDAAKAAYRFGERGIVEVLDAQRVLQSVRGDLLDAEYARQSALVDLEELGAVTPGGRP